MIHVSVERGPDSAVRAFRVRGHAGLRPRGSDIVCAAVSVLTQSAVLGIQEHLGIPARVMAGTGTLTCRLPGDLPAGLALRAQDLLETMCLGLGAVQEGYPEQLQVSEGRADGHGALSRNRSLARLVRAGRPEGEH